MGGCFHVNFNLASTGNNRSGDMLAWTAAQRVTRFDPMMDMALASGHSCYPKFEQFLWEHWDYPKTQFPNPNTYCDWMMWNLGLYGKPNHIFIHEPIQKIIDVCHGGGIPRGNGWYESIQFFNITKCTFNFTLGHYTSSGMSVIIVIRCKYGLPVAIQE
ncbi:hypothetical protein KIL84_010101 [Mauremys mutica]|uniref:Ribonuclease A-domain domain-containing protein n=1 Tax=Mauremys mutica TaxID=74926 RepID=A0A9D3XLV7_9SAUR|nr:hypothetical protein KIL84_010101 [Mauremys mutica]